MCDSLSFCCVFPFILSLYTGICVYFMCCQPIGVRNDDNDDDTIERAMAVQGHPRSLLISVPMQTRMQPSFLSCPVSEIFQIFTGKMATIYSTRSSGMFLTDNIIAAVSGGKNFPKKTDIKNAKKYFLLNEHVYVL